VSQSRGPILELQAVDAEIITPNGRHRVLDGLDLSVAEDELVAVLGPSGSGKSTLARIMGGLLQPTNGQALLRGHPLRGATPRIGMVFSTPALFPWLSVQSNIELALERLPMHRERKQEMVAWAIDRLGLEGYEEAYPRELTSGIKLRVAVARALVSQPELLVLDDPFSGLDVLTAEAVKQELLTLWSNSDVNPKSLCLFTHNISEAVEMANRVLILEGSPSKIAAELIIPLPYPRDPESPAFQELVQKVHDLLTHHRLSDDPGAVQGGRFANRVTPLPKAEPGQVFGLLEALKDAGGRMDIFDFVSDTRQNYGHVIMVVNAAEVLGLVRTPKDQVELTDMGRQALTADVNGRKALLNLQLQSLRLVATVVDMIQRAPNNSLGKEIVLQYLAVQLPGEPPHQQFNIMVAWTRYAELMGYSARRGLLYLDRLLVREGAELKELRQPKPGPRRGTRAIEAALAETAPMPEALPEPPAPPEEAVEAAEAVGAAQAVARADGNPKEG
jgi:NitT/TauT family transport system ATP-binding protein